MEDARALGASVVAAVAIIASFLPSALTTEGEMTNDPESYRGYDLIQEHFPFDPAEIVNEVVIVRSTMRHRGRPGVRGARRALGR